MRLPLKIEKIKVKDQRGQDVEQFLLTIENKDKWELSHITSRDELIKFRDRIDELIKSSSLADILKISDEQANIIEDHYSNDVLCKNCKYKETSDCLTCLFTLQSPLERILFLEFKDNYINARPQVRLNWKGEEIETSRQNKFSNLLTIPDFLIDKRHHKICVYCDGHTYHERTEEQATRDRNIDRRLQELGFRVMRFTGKEIREDVKKILGEIKNIL